MSASWRLEDDAAQLVRVPRIISRAGVTGSLALVESTGPDAAGDGRTLTGRLAALETWQEIREGGVRFMERIAANAFVKTVRERNTRIPLLYSHGLDPAIGSQTLGRLQSVSEDGQYSASLFPGVPQLLLEGLRQGAYGSSFRAQVIQERADPRPGRSTYNPKGLPESVVSEVRLLDIGPTSLPAYPTTTAQVRSVAAGPTLVPPGDEEERPAWYLDDSEPSWFIKTEPHRKEHGHAVA